MRLVVYASVTGLAFAVPAAAHHGPGTFDLRSSVSYPVATLTGVDMINPHSWLYFEVTGADGKVTKHRCEMRSVHTLRRSGWTEDLFPAGEPIAIEASPDRADPNSCYLQTIRFANGSHMDRYGQYVKALDGGIREVRGPVVVPSTEQRAFRRPGGEPNLAGDWAPEQRVMTNPRGTGGGLVPLGQLPEFDRSRPGVMPFNGVGFKQHPRGPRIGYWNWDMPGLQTAVHVDGTINDNTDRDRGLTVELRIPWRSLEPLAMPDARALPPRDGDEWRMDFSRFNRYKEAPPAADPGGWAWSPHGVWDSHIPELFTRVRFSTEPVRRD